MTVDARGQTRLGGDGETIEWLVKMRRLPARRMLDSLISRGLLQEQDVVAIGRVLGDFFRTSPARLFSAARYRDRLAKTINADCKVLLRPVVYGLPAKLIETVCEAQLALLARRPQWFEERVAQGRIIEGHGDLRPEHICLETPRPVIFDCLEFNRQLRIVDTADELAFLALECERLGAAFIEPVLFRTYADISGDRPPARLVNFYKTYRACLRAKLTAWHIHELDHDDRQKWLKRAREYLDLAEKYRPQP